MAFWAKDYTSVSPSRKVGETVAPSASSTDASLREKRPVAIPAGRPGPDGTEWDRVGAEWADQQPQRLWRMHSDLVARALIRRWFRPPLSAVLKTDLFDEAVGEGNLSALESLTDEIHGIDIAASVVEAAGRRCQRLQAKVADVRELPYPDRRFDGVLSLSTLDHFDDGSDITRSFREIRRVLKPGGQLVLTLDNPLNPIIALRQALPSGWLRKTGLVPYHCGKTLPPRALRGIIEEAGFAVTDFSSTVHCPRVMAVAAASGVERRLGGAEGRAARALLQILAAFECLEHLPTRWLTGHFSAVRAVAV